MAEVATIGDEFARTKTATPATAISPNLTANTKNIKARVLGGKLTAEDVLRFANIFKTEFAGRPKYAKNQKHCQSIVEWHGTQARKADFTTDFYKTFTKGLVANYKALDLTDDKTAAHREKLVELLPDDFVNRFRDPLQTALSKALGEWNEGNEVQLSVKDVHNRELMAILIQNIEYLSTSLELNPLEVYARKRDALDHHRHRRNGRRLAVAGVAALVLAGLGVAHTKSSKPANTKDTGAAEPPAPAAMVAPAVVTNMTPVVPTPEQYAEAVIKKIKPRVSKDLFRFDPKVHSRIEDLTCSKKWTADPMGKTAGNLHERFMIVLDPKKPGANLTDQDPIGLDGELQFYRRLLFGFAKLIDGNNDRVGIAFRRPSDPINDEILQKGELPFALSLITTSVGNFIGVTINSNRINPETTDEELSEMLKAGLPVQVARVVNNKTKPKENAKDESEKTKLKEEAIYLVVSPDHLLFMQAYMGSLPSSTAESTESRPAPQP